MMTEQKHIDQYVMDLLTSKEYRNCEYKKYINNCYSLNNIDGSISPDILNMVIRKARWNRKIAQMLPGILCYVNKFSMSNENFWMLIHGNRCNKKTCLSTIAHTELAFYQMLILNRVSGDYEAFAWLFDKICSNSFFNEADMMQILNDNKELTEFAIRYCINISRDKYGEIGVLKTAEEWLTKKNKTD